MKPPLAALLATLRGDRMHGASELARQELARAAGWARTCPASDPAELTAPNLPGVIPSNHYLECSPPVLVTAWVDKTGIHARHG